MIRGFHLWFRRSVRHTDATRWFSSKPSEDGISYKRQTHTSDTVDYRQAPKNIVINITRNCNITRYVVLIGMLKMVKKHLKSLSYWVNHTAVDCEFYITYFVMENVI